jgi:hypothetical protein
MRLRPDGDMQCGRSSPAESRARRQQYVDSSSKKSFGSSNPVLSAGFPDGIKDKNHWTSVYVSDTKDLHTARKGSAGLGIPLHRLPNRTNYVMPDGTDVHLPTGNYEKSLEHVHAFAKEIG